MAEELQLWIDVWNLLPYSDQWPTAKDLRDFLCAGNATDLSRQLAQVTQERDEAQQAADILQAWVDKYDALAVARLTVRAEHAEAQLAALRASWEEEWTPEQLAAIQADFDEWKAKKDAPQQREATLRAALEQFIERGKDIRDGSPNQFYAHFDQFCKSASALLTTPPQERS